MPKASLGIDLGTSHTAACVYVEGDGVHTIAPTTAAAESTDPRKRVKPFRSVVRLDERTGAIAAVCDQIPDTDTEDRHLLVDGAKRLIDQTYIEALDHDDLGRTIVQVQPEAGTGRCVYEVGEHQIRPVEVQAAILRHVKLAAEATMARDFDSVVLSVPAFFDASAIGATCEAAVLAGFKTVQTVPEPVAAALAMDIQISPRPIRTLTFDIGAGTTDVTAAELWRSAPGPSGLHCAVKKATGDTRLGGLDFDDALVGYLLHDVFRVDRLSDDDRFRLRRAAEAAKVELSTEQMATVAVDIAGRTHRHELTRRELECALHDHRGRDLLLACTVQLKAAIAGAAWRPEDIDCLLLVGGPTVMPVIRNQVRQVFARNPKVLAQIESPAVVDPMLAVAKGAALFAQSETENRHPHGYGYVATTLERADAENTYVLRRTAQILIPCDTVFPSAVSETQAAWVFYGGQRLVSIELIQHVPQSQRAGCGEYRFMGTCDLALNSTLAAIDISMRLNENGELETTLSNRLGEEGLTLVGVNGMRRLPIELPITRTERLSLARRDWVFVPDYQGGVRRWSVALADTVRNAMAPTHQSDCHLQASLTRLEGAIAAASSVTDEHGVTELYNAGRSLLARAYELRLIAEADRSSMSADLARARQCCYRLDSPETELA